MRSTTYSYLEPSTKRKYKNILDHVMEFTKKSGIEAMTEFTVDHMDEYRAGRELAKTTATKELQLLRQFFGFCFDRKWVEENVAKRVEPPTNVKAQASRTVHDPGDHQDHRRLRPVRSNEL